MILPMKENKDARKRVVCALQNVQNVIQALGDYSGDVDPTKIEEDLLEERIQQQEDTRMRLLLDQTSENSTREALDEEIDEQEFHERIDARIEEQEAMKIRQAEQDPRIGEIHAQSWHIAIQETKDGIADSEKLEISDFEEAVSKGETMRAIRQALNGKILRIREYTRMHFDSFLPTTFDPKTFLLSQTTATELTLAIAAGAAGGGTPCSGVVEMGAAGVGRGGAARGPGGGVGGLHGAHPCLRGRGEGAAGQARCPRSHDARLRPPHTIP
jgi:hypothetical protein